MVRVIDSSHKNSSTGEVRGLGKLSENLQSVKSRSVELFNKL